MKKKLIIISISAVVGIWIIYSVFSSSASTGEADLIVPVVEGPFKVEITTTGELKALRSVQVLGPTNARNFRVNNLRIDRIVDEGTVVEEGDFIAELDKSELFGRLSDAQDNLETEQAQYDQTRLDTALVLRQERDNLLNLEYAYEEAKLVLELSQFEPPATIRQNEYNVEKAERDVQRAKENYVIKVSQQKAIMQERTARLREEQRDFDQINALLDEFTIRAPQDGMVIYERGNDGNRIGPGSQISSWNPVVATLPDLTVMESITYVNEVDIRKVKVGQKVEIGLDAFPEKKLTGVVTRVANVGQQRPNSDAKVFEVTIRVNESDSTLRPAMTTSNAIIAESLPSARYVPLEAIHVQNDSINYVHLRNGTKQEVQLGLSNANDVQILMGLDTGDQVYLSIPNWSDDKEVKLLPELNGKRQQAPGTDSLEVEEAVERNPNRNNRRGGEANQERE